MQSHPLYFVFHGLISLHFIPTLTVLQKLLFLPPLSFITVSTGGLIYPSYAIITRIKNFLKHFYKGEKLGFCLVDFCFLIF